MSIDILEGLGKAIIEYDAEEAASLAQRAITEKVDPLKALNVLTVAIRQVGNAQTLTPHHESRSGNRADIERSKGILYKERTDIQMKNGSRIIPSIKLESSGNM